MLLAVRYDCNGRSMGLWQLTAKSGTVYVTPSRVLPKGLEGWEFVTAGKSAYYY